MFVIVSAKGGGGTPYPRKLLNFDRKIKVFQIV